MVQARRRTPKPRGRTFNVPSRRRSAGSASGQGAGPALIFIVSDIHSRADKLEALEEKARRLYGAAPGEGDYVICCGDLVGDTRKFIHDLAKNIAKHFKDKQKKKKRTVMSLYRRRPFKQADKDFIAWASQRPYTLVSVCGNHDPLYLVEKLAVAEVEFCGNLALDLGGNLRYLFDSKVYEIPAGDGTTVSVCGFGWAIDHMSSLLGHADLPEQEAFYLDGHPVPSYPVDVVIAHDAPYSRSGLLRIYRRNFVSSALDKVADKLEYKRWMCGHHHIDLDLPGGISCLYRRIIKL